MGLRLAKQLEITNCCALHLYRDLSPTQHLGSVQDYSWTSCVYMVDACCSHIVRVDGQCLPDVELLITILL